MTKDITIVLWHRDAVVLQMHQNDEALNGLLAMAASKGLDFGCNLWPTARIAAVTLPCRMRQSFAVVCVVGFLRVKGR
jgi:hypothetical protein